MSKQELIEKAVIDLNGELPDHKNEHYAIAGNVIHRPFFPCGESLVCTIDEFKATTDRMRGKPDWSECPAWCNYLAQDSDGSWWFYSSKVRPLELGFSHEPEGFHLKACIGKVIGDWRNTLEKRPAQSNSLESGRFGIMPPVNKNEGCSMAVPTKPWFEAGELPPVGAECEYLGCAKKWDKCKIVFTSEYVVVIEGEAALNELVQIAFNFGDWPKFRPIKTDKEKAIDAAVKVCTGVNIATTTDSLTMKTLNKLYDAGLLRLPDNKKPG